MLEHGLHQLQEKELEEMLVFANAAASIVTTRKGAIRSMPGREEIEKLIAGNRNQTFSVALSSVDKVKEFVNDMRMIDGDVLLLAGKYVIDAKSIMGIFSLDLSHPLQLQIEEWKEEYDPIIKKYSNS